MLAQAIYRLSASVIEPTTKAPTPVAQPEVNVNVAPSADTASEALTNSLIITGVIVVIGIIIGLAIYFIPWFIALARGSVSTVGIFFVTLFFGWSIVGFILAIIWACTSETKAQRKQKIAKAQEQQQMQQQQQQQLIQLQQQNQQLLQQQQQIQQMQMQQNGMNMQQPAQQAISNEPQANNDSDNNYGS